MSKATKNLMGKIIDFVDILSKPERITQIIRDELEEIKTNYGDERRSEINPFGGDIADEDLIPQREMVVTLTHGGYIKTQPTTDYQAQRRGGRGKQAAATKDEDFIETLFVANTHDYLMCFTNLASATGLRFTNCPKAAATAAAVRLTTSSSWKKAKKSAPSSPCANSPKTNTSSSPLHKVW